MRPGTAVTVTRVASHRYRVEVRGARITTTHAVEVPPGLAGELGWGAAEAELVRASFAFLLEREPSTSILRVFRLDEIGGYFADYAEELRDRAADRTPGGS